MKTCVYILGLQYPTNKILFEHLYRENEYIPLINQNGMNAIDELVSYEWDPFSTSYDDGVFVLVYHELYVNWC